MKPVPRKPADRVLVAVPEAQVARGAAATAVVAAGVAVSDFRTRIIAKWRANPASLAGNSRLSSVLVAPALSERAALPSGPGPLSQANTRRPHDNHIQETPERNEAHGQGANESRTPRTEKARPRRNGCLQ